MTDAAGTDREGNLRLRQSVELPEVLDLLVVGGGPGGTAAAFRAKEKGLSALVIEHDDILKRIRDYSKDKLILPGFGGGDRMRFPQGGELVLGLRFAPVDKDEMHQAWRRAYAEHCVPAQVGVELTGLELEQDGTWRALAWNLNSRCETAYRARHVIVAVGRGVPRRFDIPGNTDGIAFRLDDPADYLGSAACVIGGGTSAAEAVIAISNAKAADGDPTAVYWSYRGDKMPRVSRALSESFFEAYLRNGNVRYYPESEPAAVVTGLDRREYLAIRTDRRLLEGRPNETTHLEFAKECCVACIGEDIPEKLLGALGVHMVTGGPRGKKRMVVSPLLETVRPNLYLVGDILAQAYLETEDFDADPAGFREVRHRGNVKSAMRDGVLAVEVIARRLAGETDVRVELEDADDLPGGEEPAGPVAAVEEPAEDDGPPSAAAAPERRLDETEAVLIRMLPGGVEGEEYPIGPRGITTIGRRNADLSFPDDTRLSESHASVVRGEEGYVLRDDGGRGGVLLRLRPGEPTAVRGGALVRVGRQFLLFERTDGVHSLVHYDRAGREVGRRQLAPGTVVLGRAAPDVTLDRDDGSLSRRHLAVTVRDGELSLKDLKSLNGSFLKVRSAAPVEDGDRFQVGGQELRLMVRRAAEPRAGAAGEAAEAGEPEREGGAGGDRAAARPAPGAGGAAVTFDSHDGSFAIEAGRTVCDVAEENGIPITAECHAGVCGSDPVRVLSGAEHLEPPSSGERETLEEICELEPGPCRLACMLRPRGPLVVEIVAQDD